MRLWRFNLGMRSIWSGWRHWYSGWAITMSDLKNCGWMVWNFNVLVGILFGGQLLFSEWLFLQILTPTIDFVTDQMRRSTAGANSQEWTTTQFKIRSGSPGKRNIKFVFGDLSLGLIIAPIIVELFLENGSYQWQGGHWLLVWPWELVVDPEGL